MARWLLGFALALALVAGSARPARAQMGDWQGGVTLSLETNYRQVTEAGVDDGREMLAAAGVTLRAMASKWWLLYGVGFDYQLGGTDPGGFLYETNFYPVGLGFLMGANAKFGVMAGIGMSGVTERLPLSTQFPVEASLEFDLFSRVRVAGFARAIWVTDNRREHGSPSFEDTDEVAAGLSLRLGKRYYERDNRMSAGNGYFVGVLYQEQFGSKILGGVFGYSLNASMGRF